MLGPWLTCSAYVLGALLTCSACVLGALLTYFACVLGALLVEAAEVALRILCALGKRGGRGWRPTACEAAGGGLAAHGCCFRRGCCSTRPDMLAARARFALSMFLPRFAGLRSCKQSGLVDAMSCMLVLVAGMRVDSLYLVCNCCTMPHRCPSGCMMRTMFAFAGIGPWAPNLCFNTLPVPGRLYIAKKGIIHDDIGVLAVRQGQSALCRGLRGLACISGMHDCNHAVTLGWHCVLCAHCFRAAPGIEGCAAALLLLLRLHLLVGIRTACCRSWCICTSAALRPELSLAAAAAVLLCWPQVEDYCWVAAQRCRNGQHYAADRLLPGGAHPLLQPASALGCMLASKA